MSISNEHQTSFMFPQALLAEHGPPKLDVLSNFMSDIDQKLSEKDRQIEETLEKLVEATNALSSDNMYTNIKDAMDSLIHTSVLEECACLPPDSEDVNKLLKIIIDHIASHPGSEGVVFQQLLHISSHEGMTLPIRAPKLENVAASSLSLNTVSDTMEIENDSLWEDVRSRIKKYFLGLVQAIKSDEIYTSRPSRVELVQSMCLLYPVSDIWSSYEKQRSQRVVHLTHEWLCSTADGDLSEVPPSSLKDISERLPTLITTLKQLMREDFHLFMFGVFGQEVDLKTALWKIYISKINDELQSLLDAIAAKKGENNQMANGHAANFPSMQSLADITSQISFDDSHKTIISAPFTMSDDEVKTLLSIAEMFSRLNNFYKSLCYQASWDTTLAFKLPVKSKGHLKGVLKHKKDMKVHDMTGPLDYDRRGVLPDAIPPPFGATPGMLADGILAAASSDIVLETPASQKNKWNWFYLLDKFLPSLIESYSRQTKEALMSKLAEENVTWLQNHHLNATRFVFDGRGKDLFKGFETCHVTESTMFLVSSMGLLTPLEPLWLELPLRYFKSVLVNVSRECLQHLVSHLHKKLEEFIRQSASFDVAISVKELYVLLASAASVVLWLRGSEWLRADDESRQHFAAMETQFEELQSALSQQIKDSHNHSIQFVVLQDSESHHWQDPKAFFEDERCSFSVQMWNLHVEKLRRELWAWCPPIQAKDIFGCVLGQSVQFLSSRYSRAKPSYKRTKQFRCDILLILSSTLEHLFAAADTIEKVLPMFPSIQTHPMSQVHCPCTNLLSPLAVVTSPLPELYKIFKKGYGQRQRFREEKHPDPSWMGWIWPELFERFQSLSEMPDSSAVFLIVKLLNAQQCYNYPLLLQALLMRNSLLSCLLAREVGNTKDAVVKYEYDNNQAKFEEFTDNQQNLIVNLGKLLSVCWDFPKSLSSFLLALVEREYNYSGGKVQEPLHLNDAPLWMKCILGLLQPSFVRCLEEAASQLQLDGAPSNNPPGFLENLRQLPCGCRIRSKGQMLMKKDEEEGLLDSCRAFLSSLLSEISSFPLSLCMFFQKLEKLLPAQNTNLPLKSVGLKIIVQILLMFLNDELEVRVHLKGDLPDKPLKQVCQIGRLACIAILGRNLDNVDVPMDLLQEFGRQHGEWLTDTVHSMTEHFQRKELSHQQDICLEDAALAFQEQYFLMLYQSVSSYPDVKGGLGMIYRAVTNNVDWLQSVMEIPPMPVLRTANPSIPSFKFDGEDGGRSEPFNPVNQVNKIGDSPFTFDTISDVSVDWKGLLQSEIGLTKTSFQLLLSHRHDMQDETSLEESERKAVRVIRAKYNLDRADFV